MRVSVVASLIVAVHVVVIGSVVMTQGCASTRQGGASTVPAQVDSPPVPPLPPVAVDLPQVAQPVAFPVLQPPAPPAPLQTSVAAENVYVVKPGDLLSKIAAAHGVKTAELKELNQLADANKIRVGQKLILPDYAKPSQSQPTAKSGATAAAPVAAGGDTYVVKSGDALSKIAVAHGVKTRDLMAANNITDANKIRIGQKLIIPGAKAAEKAPKAEKAEKSEKADKAGKAEKAEKKVVEADVAPVAAPAAVAEDIPDQSKSLEYPVMPGDTMEGIARLFSVPVAAISKANNLPEDAKLEPGLKLWIPQTGP